MPYRLLCVTAHPDDESGAFGGALLLAHQAGAQTMVLCFTDGQAAHFRGDAAANDDLGRIRRAEMDAACYVLGVTRHEVLHFPDGELPQQSFQEMAAIVVDRIRRWRPHVVLTFGADGGVNLHRDHTMISAVATAAFHWSGRPEIFPGDAPAWTPHKLYHSSTPFVSVRNRPELSGSPTVPSSLTLQLGPLGQRKMEAFLQHHSQLAILDRVGQNVREHMRVERYLLVAKRGVSPVTEDVSMLTGIPGGQD